MTPLEQLLQEIEYSRNKGHHNYLEMQNLVKRLHRLYGEYESEKQEGISFEDAQKIGMKWTLDMLAFRWLKPAFHLFGWIQK